jgi:hypothetical protein
MGWWNKLVKMQTGTDTEVKEPTSEEVRRSALENEKAVATKAGKLGHMFKDKDKGK